MPKRTYQKSLIQGIGDDAALYASDEEYDEIICMDTMVEGIHFLKTTLRPFHIGYKALAVNISDIAAMGGIPLFYLVSIAIPSSWQESELMDIYEGLHSIASQFQIDLIGGDTVSTHDRLVITVTVIGKVEKGRKLLRSKARPNDVVFVTNTLGNSAVGLSLLLEKTCDYPFSEQEQFFVRCHQMPEPQVAVGRLLAQSNLRVALNDISDGIASEVHEIAESSQVGIILQANDLPRSPFMDQYQTEQQLNWILYGGEDFELVGTVSESDWQTFEEQCKKAGHPIRKIGKVIEMQGVWLEIEDQMIKIDKKGYNHFHKDR